MKSKIIALTLTLTLFCTGRVFADEQNLNQCELELQSATSAVLSKNSAVTASLSQDLKASGYLDSARAAVTSADQNKSDVESLKRQASSTYSNLNDSVRFLKDGGTKEKYDEVERWNLQLSAVRDSLAAAEKKSTDEASQMFLNLKKQFPTSYPLNVYEISESIGLELYSENTFSVDGVPVIPGWMVETDAQALAGLKIDSDNEQCDLSNAKLLYVVDPRYSLEKISVFLLPNKTNKCHYGVGSLATMVELALKSSSNLPGCRDQGATSNTLDKVLSQVQIK